MTTYTKATIITYQNSIEQSPEAWLTAVNQKTQELVLANKTDGQFAFMDEYNVRRVWADQNAADEWVTFLMACNEQYGVVVTSVSIIDNPTGTI